MEDTSWIEALAQLAAAGGFLVALIVFRVQLIDRRRRFADGVTAWVTLVEYSQGVMEKFGAIVGNASDAAVFDVVVSAYPTRRTTGRK